MDAYKITARKMVYILLSSSEEAAKQTVIKYLSCSPEEIQSVEKISGRCFIMNPTMWICED